MPRTKLSASKSPAVKKKTKPRAVIRTPYPDAPDAPKPSAIFAAVRKELLRVDPETGKIEVLTPKPHGTLSLELASERVARSSRVSHR